jgi:hypothetical protein
VQTPEAANKARSTQGVPQGYLRVTSGLPQGSKTKVKMWFYNWYYF